MPSCAERVQEPDLDRLLALAVKILGKPIPAASPVPATSEPLKELTT